MSWWLWALSVVDGAVTAVFTDRVHRGGAPWGLWASMLLTCAIWAGWARAAPNLATANAAFDVVNGLGYLLALAALGNLHLSARQAVGVGVAMLALWLMRE